MALRDEVDDYGRSGINEIKFEISYGFPDAWVSIEKITNYQSILKIKIASYEVFPLFVDVITGGFPRAFEINKAIAEVANELRLPFATGSIKAGLKNSKVLYTYNVKSYAPNVPYFIDIGS